MRIWRRTAVLAAALTLAACGGGGEEASQTTATTVPPTPAQTFPSTAERQRPAGRRAVLAGRETAGQHRYPG
jgi:ABC-type glycerol-3-phosphate transport system substrate-binding protein